MNDKYFDAININFPNLSEEEISSAEIGRELRALLPDERKIELFPSKKELQNILALTTQMALKPLDFEHKKTYHQLKLKSKNYEDTVGFYYDRGRIDPTYSKRFLWLEKLLAKWAKKHQLEKNKFELSFYFPLSHKFENPMAFKNYKALADQFYNRLKYIDEVLIDEYKSLSNISILNNKVNYGGGRLDRFNGSRRDGEYDQRVLVQYPYIAFLANDPNKYKILEAEVLKYCNDESIQKRYELAFKDLEENMPNNLYEIMAS